jgi:hypothetical protein
VNGWEQKGYDAWLDLWIAHNCTPTAGQCPAKWMKPESQERAEFIKGWNKAKNESRIKVGT